MCHAYDLEELFGEGLAAAGKRKSMAAAVLDSEGLVKLAVFSLDLERQLIQNWVRQALCRQV